MNYATAVAETWRHHPLHNAATDYTPLVRYATLAASSHNTQPWKFRLQPGRITILPDLTRRCPAVDPDDHHLYASLGCAAENLLLAAQAAGLQAHCAFNATESCVEVVLEPGKSTNLSSGQENPSDNASPSPSQLFVAIPRRQCSRVAFDGAPLTENEQHLLDQTGRGDGVALLLLTGSEQKEQIAEFVAKGNTVQFADAAWARELKSWVRFNARDAIETGDGLYGPVMGSPDVPRWLGRLFMNFGFSAARQNQKDFRNIRSASAIAVIHSAADDKAHWVEAGRCCQRLALQATALGLCTAFINQPVEVAALRPQFAAFLGVGARRPDLVLRIGRGPQSPRSLRRPLEQVLL